jgi:hypothetical protein
MIRRRSAASALLFAWAAIALLAMAACGVPSEGYANFWVTNNTNEQLTVTSYPVEIPPSNNLASPASVPTSLSQSRGVGAGKRAAFMFGGLDKGSCVTYMLIAYDAAGHEVARRPSPICEDAHGHGNTWTIAKQ